jgi:hypothetical protein
MLTKEDLPDLILEALKAKNRSASLIEVCKFIWKNHHRHLETSGDLFFTWQYDIRWAANKLRRTGKMKAAELSQKGIWELS